MPSKKLKGYIKVIYKELREVINITESISLYGEFPRIIGYPVRLKVIYDIHELNEYIKKNISKHDLHISLYSFKTLVKENGITKPDYETAVVNKVYFDLDEGDWVKNMKDLHNWCMSNDIIHRFHLSSYVGGHFFIGCRPQVQYKKTALYNFQAYLSKKFNILIDKGVSTLGDIARSFRIEKTFNYKRQCYCNPITSEELGMIQGVNDPLLKKLTEEPREENSSDFWYGSKLVNLKPFDKNEHMFEINFKAKIDVENLLSNDEINKLNIPFNDFPPCIQNILSNPEMGFHQRYLATLYLRDQKLVMLDDQQIVSILRCLMSEEKWTHCATNIRLPGHNPGENLKPIRKTLSSMNYQFPSCFKMEKMGYCPKYCGKQWHPIYE